MTTMKEGDYFVAVCKQPQCGRSFRKVLIGGKYKPRERDMITPHVHTDADSPSLTQHEQIQDEKGKTTPGRTYEEKLREIDKETAEVNDSLASYVN